MDFWQLITKRRSIRRYNRRPVEPEKVGKIIEAALRAPSSRNLQPWEFIVVNGADLLAKLAQARSSNSFLQGAPLAVVVCANPEKCDVWVENAAIAATFIILAAEALGLGCCWLQIRERRHSPGQTAGDFVAEILQIPPPLQVEAIIAIGYPAEQKAAHQREELKFEQVFHNTYGKPFKEHNP